MTAAGVIVAPVKVFRSEGCVAWSKHICRTIAPRAFFTCRNLIGDIYGCDIQTACSQTILTACRDSAVHANCVGTRKVELS